MKRTTPKDVLRAALVWKQGVDQRGGRKSCHEMSVPLYDAVDNFLTTSAQDRIEKEVFDDPGIDT